MEVERERPAPAGLDADPGGDSDEVDGSLDQTGFLLQRLQELKAWQKEQEMKLLQDQQRQMQQLVEQESNDDDTTIDQDFSSLHSYAETPQPPVEVSTAYSSSFESENEDSDGAQRVVRLSLDSSMPSWAQTDSGTEPKTIKSSNTPNVDDIPIVNPKKTFEELLAEKLGDEDSHPQDDIGTPPAGMGPQGSPRTRSKSFLRKGSGLARYGGVGSPPKAFKRSRSTTNVSQKGDAGSGQRMMKPSKSCSKLDMSKKDTVASNSKKSPPRRTISNRRISGPKATPPPAALKNHAPLPAKNLLLPKPNFQSVDEKENESPVYDSVEWSFREKLKTANKKHKQELEELAAFEALEEAACDSSFCSSSSRVRNLIGNASLPSPITRPASNSTPAPKGTSRPGKSVGEDPSLGPSLLQDIQKFLQQRGAVIQDSENDDVGAVSEDEDTLKDPPQTVVAQHPEDSDSWDSVHEDDADEVPNGGVKNEVRFLDTMPRLDFSPPRIPKHSPSYLIWSIFTKEREKLNEAANRKMSGTSQRGKKSARRAMSPLSGLGTNFPGEDQKFVDTLLNAKLIELEKEINQFRQDNIQLQNNRRKLNTEKKTLQSEKADFEKSKEMERKKCEEEKRRIKRDRALLEKAQKQTMAASTNGPSDKRTISELEELQNKLSRLQDEVQKKESKWSISIGKLQDTIKILEKENQHLHEENYKLKMKSVTSKVSTHLGEQFAKPANEPQVISLKESGSSSMSSSAKSQVIQSPDSGFRSAQSPQTASSHTDAGWTPQHAIVTPSMSFSPADSLDSNMTLVSGGDLISNSEDKKANANRGLEGGAKKTALGVLQSAPGTTETKLSDGSVEIRFQNGNRKVISPDGQTTKVSYYNGDLKESLPSGLVKYFYAQTKTWHLTYPDKKEVLQFSNGQEEIRYPDGVVQITFPDGSVKKISADGSEDLSFPDGTKVEVASNGDRTLFLANGQREVHTSQFKRREYPDGTIKTLFNDGRQETKYANGRLRVKNKDGTLLQNSLTEQ